MINLILVANFICDEGGIALASALKSNTVLTEISLSHNSIGFSGAREFANSLGHHNTSLVKLNLAENHFDERVSGLFIICLQQNTTLKQLTLSGITGGQELSDKHLGRVICLDSL